jgi:hypothetical protein
MEPPRQRRISYRKCRNRPSQLIPTGPPGHDPAFFPSQVQDRRALDDESVVREPDLQALLDENGPDELLRQVRAAAVADAGGRQWPRTKRSDGATAVYLVRS